MNQRIYRMLGTLRDPVSYRLLWCSLSNQLVQLPEAGSSRGAVAQIVGLPTDEPTASDDRIPEIVFQTWSPPGKLSPNYRWWRESFIVNNPGYRFFFWDDLDSRIFVSKWFPWFLSRFDACPLNFRTNLARLLFLFVHGGFSVHIDQQCLRPLQAIRDYADIVLGRMGHDSSFEHSVQNAFMASRPNEAYWLLALAIAVERLSENSSGDGMRPEWSTGPVLLKDAADFYLAHDPRTVLDRIRTSCPEVASNLEACSFGRLVLAPSELFCPINWNNPVTTLFRQRMKRNKRAPSRELACQMFPKAYVVTYWSEPWE
jgi:hypothetical protein